jgi:hypothetical protein
MNAQGQPSCVFGFSSPLICSNQSPLALRAAASQSTRKHLVSCTNQCPIALHARPQSAIRHWLVQFNDFWRKKFQKTSLLKKNRGPRPGHNFGCISPIFNKMNQIYSWREAINSLEMLKIIDNPIGLIICSKWRKMMKLIKNRKFASQKRCFFCVTQSGNFSKKLTFFRNFCWHGFHFTHLCKPRRKSRAQEKCRIRLH